MTFVQPIWNDFQDGIKLRLRLNSAKYIARYLYLVGQNGII